MNCVAGRFSGPHLSIISLLKGSSSIVSTGIGLDLHWVVVSCCEVRGLVGVMVAGLQLMAGQFCGDWIVGPREVASGMVGAGTRVVGGWRIGVFAGVRVDAVLQSVGWHVGVFGGVWVRAVAQSVVIAVVDCVGAFVVFLLLLLK